MTSKRQKPTIPSFQQGLLESSDQGREVRNINIYHTESYALHGRLDPSTHTRMTNKNQNPTTPSFQQGLLESSDQRWEVRNINIYHTESYALHGRLDPSIHARMTSKRQKHHHTVIPAGRGKRNNHFQKYNAQ